MNLLRVFLLIAAYLCHSESYKILGIFPLPMHSHYSLSTKLLKELAARGHEVTVVTPFPRRQLVSNFTEITVESLIQTVEECKKHLSDLENETILQSTKFLTNLGLVVTEAVLQHENVQKLFASGDHYDVVIVTQHLNEGLAAIAHYFKAPLVLLSPMPLFPWANFLLSQVTSSSYVPNLLSPYTGHMNFWQRTANVFYDLISITYYQWFILPQHREIVKKYVPGAPDLYSILNNVSLLLTNTHMSSYEALPQLPNTVEIGGLHIEEQKELSEELQVFLNDSKEGVVIFSMGSNLKSSALFQFKIDDILKAFSKLKQNVIWKWESKELPQTPKNVKLMQWLPQSAILAHPHVKALITHGGLLSTMESIYYGVPVIGIPFFSDQKMNMATAAAHGYAEVVPFQHLNEKELSLALDKILNDPKYKRNAEKRSFIMRDRAIKPLESAIYWIEYVVRHQGAAHLRSPASDLTWYQRNLLDVYIFIVIAIFLAVISITLVLKKLCSRPPKARDLQKKNK